MAKRRDSGSELTPEDFIESRQDDSDSPNPVLDIIRNVDAARDDDGSDSDSIPGVASSMLTETSSEAAWDPGQTAEKWALLVGINNYQNDISQLRFCVSDVEAFRQALVDVLDLPLT